VKSLLHHNTIPWKNISISGFILDPKGEKMSKSKGNVIDPTAIMQKFSADALRYWAAGSKLGEDLAYQEKDVVTGQKTVTKLWNASNFILSHLKDYALKKPKTLELMDEWLLNTLHTVVVKSTDAFEHYAYWQAKAEIDFFFWHTLCDQYLEIVKDRLYNSDKRGKTGKESAQYTLRVAFSTLLKLFAPFLPFITEELYFQLFQKEEKTKSIHISSWPSADIKLRDSKSEQFGDRFVEILSIVRQEKSKQKVSLATEITLTLEKKDYVLLQPVFADLRAVTKAREIREGSFSIVL
jgi:valyl-tRNA synthetase